MRNHSFTRSGLFRPRFLGLVGFAVLSLTPYALQAQCSDDANPDSIACQMQESVNPSERTSKAPADFNFPAPDQTQPRADFSNEASVVESLSGESTYTEKALLENRKQRQLRPRRITPEPPTEFQLFIAATTGQQLPIYGANLFIGQQVSFGPIDSAPAPADLILGADDELRVRIWGQVNFSANLRISREGDIYLPKIGTVHVAGLTVAAARDHLRQAMDRIYRNFELTVDLGEIHSIQIYVAGMARQPGEYTVSALSTLVDAVFASGGPSSTGSMRHVQLKRDGKILTDFDLYELLIQGDKTGDRQLQPGDVLYIPPAGPQVAVFGSVRRTGVYELRGEETLGDLFGAAGGLTAMAAGSSISIDRITDRARRSSFELANTPEGLGAELADGDIVRVDAVTSSYRETVTLRGSVANPGHFRWRPGMHLSDLIPDRDSLVTRGYWWRRTQLGLPAPEFSPLEDRRSSVGRLPDRTARAENGSIAGEMKLQGIGNEEPANMETGAPAQQTPSQGQQTYVQDRQGAATRLSERAVAVPSPGGETDWDYAVIERLDRATMTTSLIPFDLGKLVLQHDASQDLALEASDVVTIFSQDDINLPIDRKTKYIQLEGEIANAGVYSVSPGETLRSLLQRAGGLTPKAYLYGAEFTRKSTQTIEQQRMNEYADRLDHLIQRNAIPISGTEGGQNSLQTAMISANQNLVGRLRQARATGRIVLNLRPDSVSENDLPDMALEDGDRLVIPSRPSTIQVIGSVFNQNAFLYTQGAKVGEYLRLAGGPTREADRRQIFVLRADGSVIHRGSSNSIFDSSTLDKVRLYPGDTVVVPEKIVRPSGLREFTAWTQIMSQLSLTAAALNAIN